MRRNVLAAALLGALLSAPGCSPGVNTSYGRIRGTSINGTGVLAEMFRDRGHQVRSAVRLSDDLSLWAEVIVRFAPYPGPPSREEAQWYGHWLDGDGNRQLIYVVGDYDARHDYWTAVREQLPPNSTARTRERVDEEVAEAASWPTKVPFPLKEAARADEWFAVKSGASNPRAGRAATVCQKLGGPWSRGVDPARAALVRDDVLVADSETVLLTGDKHPLVMSWTRPNQARVLAVASGTFLLNAALATHPERAALARRVAAWPQPTPDDDGAPSARGVAGETPPTSGWPRRVAFLEGMYVSTKSAELPSVFDLLRIEPFGMIAAQLLTLGLAGCLARAPRLGRPRAEQPTDADRPVAHPEALGALMARSTQAGQARALLEAYRRWRNGPGTRSGL